MDRKGKAVHWVLLALGWLGLVWEFVFFLLHWSSLPEKPGIHFTPEGEFDVYAEKFYGFYPHLITTVTLVVIFAATEVIRREKLKLGLKISEKGKRLFLSSLVITLDIAALMITVIGCLWVYAVSVQEPSVMDTPPSVVLQTGIYVLFAGVMFQLAVNWKYKEKPQEADLSDEEKRRRRLRFLLTGSTGNLNSGVFHRLSRYVSWIIVVMLTGIFLFCLERLPKDDIADEHHGKAWFENLGGYYDKWLVFLPFIVSVPIMLILELLSVRAVKKGNAGPALLFDRLKLLLAVFSGWWMLMLNSELSVGAVSVILYAALTAGCIISYFTSRKKLNSGEDKN